MSEKCTTTGRSSVLRMTNCTIFSTWSVDSFEIAKTHNGVDIGEEYCQVSGVMLKFPSEEIDLVMVVG